MMKLRHFDVLRACLALMVLVGHARMMLWMPWREWIASPHSLGEELVAYSFSAFRYGHEAVVVFFALSGFFIHLRSALARVRGDQEVFSTDGYLRRRAYRILPPYYAVLVFTLALDMIGRCFWPMLYLAQTGDNLLDQNFSHAGYSAAAVVPALFAQPSLLGIRFGGNGPLWSIGSEVFYYALYPLFMLFWRRSRLLGYGLGLSIGVTSWFIPWAGWWAGALSYYPIWLTGALVAEMLCARQHLKSAPWFFVLSLCLAVAAFTLSHVSQVRDNPALIVPVFMLLGGSVILLTEQIPFDLMKFKVARILEWLGIRSYSLYIFHFPVLVLVSAWCIQTQGGKPGHGWLAALGFLLALAAGLLGFHIIERRFLPQRLQPIE